DDSGTELRLNASALKAVGGKNGSPVNLTRHGFAGALYLESRLERNPLFVHRHLAATSTARAAGAGRPVEVYHAGIRIFGKDLPIALDNKVDAALRVITFETPA